jgi:hypothetical protein
LRVAASNTSIAAGVSCGISAWSPYTSFTKEPTRSRWSSGNVPSSSSSRCSSRSIGAEGRRIANRANEPVIFAISATGNRPRRRIVIVASENSRSAWCPIRDAKKPASGVPRCGVATITTLRTRCASASISSPASAPGSATPGVVNNRASSPPVECPIRCTGAPSGAVSLMTAASSPARTVSDEVGFIRTR